mmetsp:Transcript_48902/g.116245  ORF Transcript_48902/g.116245 Transcript_48902/m.116245 type:complete len:307 (-) Transcript_48902:127-1047(-)|eukprot:CAMPEP_0178376586 /NCGR_PEP_ID=MMETSP0689_2-20121128/3479_1 /TAXON_ID=160604 /ORGANISM="Amphidinium massartii, Strain CS-259" /LENGTH=306 /DNA_ID=CAMNT_0019996613 /DNA_START=41 /DNA_END=961 /DNA_ORIENTATION=-
MTGLLMRSLLPVLLVVCPFIVCDALAPRSDSTQLLLGNLRQQLDGAEPLRHPPLNPLQTDPPDDFPKLPPVKLASRNVSIDIPLLAAGIERAPVSIGLRVRQDFFTVHHNDLAVANTSGSYIYASTGLSWSWHDNANLYLAKSGIRLAAIWRWVWSFHPTYEVETYEPLTCPEWTLQDAVNSTDDDGSPTYRLMRVTQEFLPMFSGQHWLVERYKCDGTTEEVLRIKARYWPSLYTALDILKPGVSEPVATIDQPYLFQAVNHYDVWVGAAQDPTLMTLLSVIMHMRARAGGGGSHSSSSGGRTRR